MPMPGDAAVGPALSCHGRAGAVDRFVEVAAHERGDGGERFARLAAGGGDVDADGPSVRRASTVR